jgi:glycosyltransferase involved in cell wall biosynthesis
MLLIIRGNNVISDPRVGKYLKFLDQKRIEYRILGWDRLDENIPLRNGSYFKLKSSFGNGGTKAVIHRLKWTLFIIKYLFHNRNIFHVIHACDLDAAFPTSVFKFLFRRKVKVIFDVFDWYSATFYGIGKFIRLIIYWMEKFTIKYSDEVIICAPERIQQIPFKLNKEELILPNIPYFDSCDFLQKDSELSFCDDKITISYVGGFYEGRFLHELLQVAEKGLFNLLIAGFGNKNIEEKCLELSSRVNVKYFGQVDYKKGLNIMYNSDAIFAMYSKNNPNHIFAAPNKYYEGMLLGKPIISTKGILLEKKILLNGIGYTIDESIAEFQELIISLNRSKMKEQGLMANNLWHEQYKNVTINFMNYMYLPLIA